MNKVKAVLFDLDGTLLDTADDLGNALNHVLRSHGQATVNAHTYRKAASHGSIAMLTLGFGSAITQFDMASLRQQFLDYYQANICVDTKLFDGAAALLESLNERSIDWGIVTNKPELLTLKLLPHFSCFDQSKIVVGGDTTAHSKPHPAPMLLAANALTYQCSDILYLGDAERDMQAANNVGMISVLARYGYIAETDQIKDWNADLIIDSPLDLLKYL